MAVLKGALTPSETTVNNYINKTFQKAVKPSVVGQKTFAQTEQYKGKVINAVRTIAENKNNLSFTTEEGIKEAGRLPKSVREFAESINQSKKQIYDEYNTLAKQAGKEGGSVNIGKISGELDKVVNNKALQISHPEAIKYAEGLKERFIATGKIDTETAEQLVQNYNTSLTSFYRNPTYESASRAAIDAGIVNSIRKELDSVIEGLTGSEYQILKNKYGALKTIEQDVVRSANGEAKKNLQGLIDYTDIFSGGDIVSGILSLNPALFTKGVVQKSIKEFFKIQNNPNRAIEQLFKRVDGEKILIN